MQTPFAGARRRRFRRPLRRPRLLSVLLLALAATGLGTVRAPSADASFPFGESFQDATAPGFVLGGTASLTANGGGDTPGDGWLRLTPLGNQQFGYAYNQTAFPSSQGISYEFDYAAWGGSGADGLAFVLFDGATTDGQFNAGVNGGALGYSKCVVGGQTSPGLSNAYVGIGFDVYGNFASTGICQQTGIGPGLYPNRITIRGGAPNYDYLASTAATGGVGTGNRAGARRVRVTVMPKNGQTVLTASVRTADGAEQQFADELVLPTPPPTLKFGFTASTGGMTNNHEIRGMHVAKPTDLQVAVDADAAFADRDAEQSYTATITNAGPNPVTGVAVSATMPHTTDVAWSCTATGGATCPATTGTGLPTTGGAMPVGGKLTFAITGTLTATADDSRLTFSATPTGDTSELEPADNEDEAQTDVTPLTSDPPTYALTANGLATAVSGGAGRGGHLTRSWQWYRCEADGSDCQAITDATAVTYQTTTADRDHNLRVRETLTNDAGAAHADSGITTLPDTTITAAPPSVTRLASGFTFASATTGATFECRVDGATTWTACTTPLTLTGLVDGPHAFRVRAVYGGLSDTTPATHGWTVDTTTGVAFTTPPSGPTNKLTPAFAFTGEPGASWRLHVDGSMVDHGTFAAGGAVIGWNGASLHPGDNVVRVEVEDAAGNTAHDEITLRFDPFPPVKPTVGTGPPPATSDPHAQVTFDVEPGSQAECRFDGGPWLPCTSPWTGGPLPDGDHVVEVRAVDDAGNIGETLAHDWTVDTVAPPAITWGGVPSPTSSDPSPTLTFTAEPGSRAACRIDDGPWEPCSSPFTAPTLGDGPHRVAVRIIDRAGNESPIVEHGWTVDTTVPAPPILLPGDRPRPIAPPVPAVAATRVAARATVTASTGGVRVGCAIDTGTLERCVVRIYDRSSNGTRGALLGTGTVRVSADGRSGTTDVKLNPRGLRAVIRSLGGRPVIVSSVATQRGGTTLRAQDVRATLYPQRLLTIPTVLPFSIDRGVVTGAARRVVAEVARQLRYATSVRCIGFTDAIGPAAHNRALGLRRAKAVCRTLRQMGVRAELHASSRGEDQPRASNATAAGRAKNRRVELVIGY